MYRIKKDLENGIEFLPHVSKTDLRGGFYGEKADQDVTATEIQLAKLYQAIADRENYYQLNTPAAFGNPEYTLLVGIVRGFLMALEAEETIRESTIIISKNSRKLLEIDSIHRHKWYYESVRNNLELLTKL